MYLDTRKGYTDTLKGIWILWDKSFRILKETTLRKYGILDRFDTLLYFGHNSLIWSSIELIEIDMERQEKDLELLCFAFCMIRIPSWSKLACKRTKIFWNAEYGILDRFDTLLYFGHNSLVWTPIELIQINLEIQEEDLQN